MSKRRILITGGGSYLGRCLTLLATPIHDVGYTFFNNDPLNLAFGRLLDVREATAVTRLIRQFQPQVIIHTVGSNRGSDMGSVIRQGTQNVLRAAAENGARFIHLSTDSIFDGLNPPYDETAVPSPVNEYGRAKADAEAIVAENPNHVIIRTSLIYGLKEIDHGTAWMARALAAGEPVQLFDNQIRNPVWVETLSRACLELADSDFTGVLNVAGRQAISRAEFSLRLLDFWQVQPRDTLTIGPSVSGRWPLDCRLDLRLGTAVLDTPLLGVDEVIKTRSQN
ncbi:MAG: SDR family oxidoreductase [Ardenticatenaceae bacterium]|nr:SDR family oxidoreductase [Ardenticatenaceae bacterium]MCB9444604.1 SDR family oxidoreductase [Ardenticatenaceae bacterium]